MSKLDALHFIYRNGLYFWPFPQTFLLSRGSQSNFLSFKKFSKLLNISCVSADMLILDFLFLEPTRRRPCVGLCYYEKLLALQGRRDAEREQNETTQVSFLQPLQLCISSSTTPTFFAGKENCGRTLRWNLSVLSELRHRKSL